MKFYKCPDKKFMSPIIITAKRDKTVKLALDSKTLHKYIQKNSIESLIDSIPKNFFA